MSTLDLVSLERPESTGGNYKLTFKVPASLLEASPDVDISGTSVRVEGANGEVATASLPSGCEPIDQDLASCKLQKRKGQLCISWPAAVHEDTEQKELRGPVSLDAGYPDEVATPIAPIKAIAATASGTKQSDKGAARASLDYSRFDGIGDDVQEPRPQPFCTDSPTPSPLPTPAAASAAVTKRSAALDYSRFEEVSEEDATASVAELEKLWRQQTQLHKMRGETTLSFAEWQKARARLRDPDGGIMSSRGLWSRTNMEESFFAEATRAAEEQPADADLPALPAPDLLSAMASAPGAEILDVAKWARSVLQEELVKACATDKVVGGKDSDLRVDAIVYAVDVGEGSAGLCVEGQSFFCAYRFAVKVSYCVATSERPAEGGDPVEAKYMGDVNISELASGIGKGSEYQEALTKLMKTSLREPKPPKRHLAAMRPVLGRLELSLAHFVRRFERRFLAHPSKALQKAS